MDRLFKIILRTVVTFCNLPLLALSLAGFMSEKAGYSPGLSSVFILLAIMAAGNIVVVWRWRAAAAGPFGIAYKLLRGFLWMVNIVALLVAGVGSSKNPVALYLLLPSGFALLAMMLGGRKNTAEESSVETLQPAAASVQDAVPVSAAAEKPKGNPFAEPDIPAYYAAHRTVVDAMQREFTGLLIDKYGLQPDFVRETFPTRADGVPPAVRWHIDGKAAAQAADEFYAKLYQSPEANNPKIFTRHVETGEPLPPDYPYDSWVERNLGTTLTQRVLAVVSLVFLYATTAAAQGDFIVSKVWFAPAFALGIAAGVPCGLWLYRRWRRGHGKFKPDGRAAPWLVLMVCLFWGFCIYVGGGYMAHGFFADTERGNYAYRKDDFRPRYSYGVKCLRVNLEPDKARGRESRMCIKTSDITQMDETGYIDLVISRSWFGIGIEKYALPFGVRHGYAPTGQAKDRDYKTYDE